MNEIFKRLKLYRLKHGYSQQKIADQLNISQSAYAKIESGITKLDIERLNQICRILELSPSALIMEGHEQQNESEDQNVEHSQKETVELLKEEIRFLRKMLTDNRS